MMWPSPTCHGISGGALIRPCDAPYDAERRTWNGAIDRRPALIARCTGAADVRAAVGFARERELVVAVRGGGHNVAGTAVRDGGIVIDLSPMKGMWVDPRARIARAQPGLLWGEFDHETQPFGLAAPGGIISHTGIGGLTLGGGLGWLMRRHGLTADDLLSADVVTADRALVRASAEEHGDLFWGLRGGGGNFGIVTSFEYRLHAVGPTVLAGLILHPAARAREVLAFYRDHVARAPDEVMTIVVLRMAPPAPFLPESIHGQPVVIIAVCCAGTVEAGERAVAPLRRFGEPLMDLIRPTSYASHQALLDASVPHGLGYYSKSEYLQASADETVDEGGSRGQGDTQVGRHTGQRRAIDEAQRAELRHGQRRSAPPAHFRADRAHDERDRVHEDAGATTRSERSWLGDGGRRADSPPGPRGGLDAAPLP
jgi:hypothetical protein